MPISDRNRYSKYYSNFTTSPLKHENELRCSWTQVTVEKVSGKVTSSAVASNSVLNPDHMNVRAEASAKISSRTVCTGYDFKIEYIGPVNIGDRTIITQRIPNYKLDPEVQATCRFETGISNEAQCCGNIRPYSSCGIEMYSCFTLLTCTFLCTNTCFKSCCSTDKYIDDRADIFISKLEDLADERASQDIAKSMVDADRLVEERINYVAQLSPQAQPAGGSGMIAVGAKQLQELLQLAAAGQAAVNQGFAGNPPSPVLQFSQQGQRLPVAYPGVPAAYAVPVVAPAVEMQPPPRLPSSVAFAQNPPA